MDLGASIITMHPLRLEQEIEFLVATGLVDYLHVDMMDGEFVPRYGIYPEIVAQISENFDISLDIHLMVSDVEFAIDQLDQIKNIASISFHYFKNEGRVFKLIDAVKSRGAVPVLALDLSTDVSAIEDILQSGELSGLLFMGIHPGVLRQNHRPMHVVKKLNRLKRHIPTSQDFIIQIDGGFNIETAAQLASVGINSFVGGSSSIYKGVNWRDPWQDCKTTTLENLRKIHKECNFSVEL
jgi:ribulose-phosphate 3-epimerase